MLKARRWTWILRVVQRVLDKSEAPISLSEALGFVKARFNNYGPTFTLGGVAFRDTDPVIWGQALNIFFRLEYTPAGFSIGPEDVVVDIGANRGVFVALAACKTNGPILAFEPDSDNFAALERLVGSNGLNHVELHGEAVAATSGYVRLYKASSHTRHTLIGKDVLTGEGLGKSVVVPAVSLDDALKHLPKVDFLKMDCEGAEFEVIPCANRSTLRKVARVVMEYHDYKEAEDVVKLVNTLEMVGFSVVLHQKSNVPLGMLFAVRRTP